MASVNPELAVIRQHWEEIRTWLDTEIYKPLSDSEIEQYKALFKGLTDLAKKLGL